MKSLASLNNFISGFLIFIFLSCADKIITEADLINQNSPDSNIQTNFSSIQKKIFTPSCALAGCHSGSEPQAGLDLSTSNAYFNLVNVTSVLNPPMVRVSPGDPENSFLIKVLEWNDNVKMPPGGPQIQQSMIDSIKMWINKGAPND